MDLSWEERQSDSPMVERIWRSYSDQVTQFTSMAQLHCELVITRHEGKVSVTLRGPETRASIAQSVLGAEYLGIQLKVGAYLPQFPARQLMNRKDALLPLATGGFWLDSRVWQLPDYENADTFVARLVRAGLLVQNPAVAGVLHQQSVPMSLRTVQRHFLQATGMSYSTLFQINRARYATSLLKQGYSILDAVHEAGYADQPHLTRALKALIGQTPAQIASMERQPLSFLFKTTPF